MLVDSGSSINVIDEQTFDKINQKVALRRASTRVFAHGSSKTLHFLNVADIYVIKGNYGCLLGYETCVQLAINNKFAIVTEK